MVERYNEQTTDELLNDKSLIEAFIWFNEHAQEDCPPSERPQIVVYGRLLEGSDENMVKYKADTSERAKTHMKRALGGVAVGIGMFWVGSKYDTAPAQLGAAAGYMTAAISGMYAIFGTMYGNGIIELDGTSEH